MKRSKRIIFLTFLLTLLSYSICFAAEDKTPKTEYNPKTMTLEERARWVEENVEPIYSGEAQRLSRSEWLYTNITTTYAGPGQYDVGKLETQMRFTVDNNRNVSDWNTVVFRASNISQAIVDSDYFETEIYPHNIRVVYEATFTDVSGAYFVDHWYNLHGDGKYDVRVVKGDSNIR